NGYREEARAWREWLLRAVAGRASQLNIMYGVTGERRLTELTLDWLPGYENSAPVRVGNAAWKQCQLDIFGEVMDSLHVSPEVGAFTQYYGSKDLDASLLMMAQVGFLPPDDPRIRGTVEAIEKHLTYDGFVLRYATETNVDGLPPGEGVFFMCTFWLADNYALMGRRDEARKLFE